MKVGDVVRHKCGSGPTMVVVAIYPEERAWRIFGGGISRHESIYCEWITAKGKVRRAGFDRCALVTC